MKCLQCGNEMERMETVHRYIESGLKNIMLMDVFMHKCGTCSETEIEIPGMEELHNILAMLILLNPAPLSAEQVKYLRKHVGYTQEELADAIGVTRITITRWESSENIGRASSKQLRQWYLQKKGEDIVQLSQAQRPDVLHKLLEILVEKSPPSETLRLRKEQWLPEAVPS